ncbi:asparaginase [Candidatus Woesearchaeota archaeon]|nr:asparaginase [Candidatus Woesearchaeota archaeon]
MVTKIDPEKLNAAVADGELLYSRFIDEEIPDPERVVEWWGEKGKKRLLVLYTGGTLGMEPHEDEKTHEEILKPSLSLDRLLDVANMVTGCKSRYNILGYKISHIDSTEINVRVWSNMARLIADHYEDIDGVTILHGTDTMAYTSAAMAFALQRLSIPVVSTGAQMILQRDGTDVIGNLTGALKLASDRLAGSLLYFNGNVFCGTRVSKVLDEELPGFDSSNFGRIGYLGANGIKPDPRALLRGTYTPSDLKYEPGFGSGVIHIGITPFTRPAQIAAAASQGCEAIVLSSFGPGNLPRWHNPVVEYLVREAGVPVYVSSQCAGSGISETSHYGPGVGAQQAGAVPTMDMSGEATVSKLMWVKNRTNNLDEIKHHMVGTCVAGEITLPQTYGHHQR